MRVWCRKLLSLPLFLSSFFSSHHAFVAPLHTQGSWSHYSGGYMKCSNPQFYLLCSESCLRILFFFLWFLSRVSSSPLSHSTVRTPLTSVLFECAARVRLTVRRPETTDLLLAVRKTGSRKRAIEMPVDECVLSPYVSSKQGALAACCSLFAFPASPVVLTPLLLLTACSHADGGPGRDARVHSAAVQQRHLLRF